MRCFVKENVTVVLNETDSVIGTFSCFINRGMKDDVDYINGTAHLTEHLIAKSIDLCGKVYAFTNANVDKECTCFWGQAFSTVFYDLINATIDMNLNLSDESIEREKNYIWSQENSKLLKDFKLLDLEKLEYSIFGEKNNLHMPTLVTKDDFFKIDQRMIRKYIYEKIKSSKITCLFSINPLSVDVDRVVDRVLEKVKKRSERWIDNLDTGTIFFESELLCMQARNTLQIKKHNAKFFMAAFKIDGVKTIDDYMAINCLAVLYRTILNTNYERKNRGIFQVSLKDYDETVLLVVHGKRQENICRVLSAMNLDNFFCVLDNIKCSLLFSLFEKISNPIELHRFQFKTLKFYDPGCCFDVNDLQEIFDKITMKKLQTVHNKCLASGYYQQTR